MCLCVFVFMIIVNHCVHEVVCLSDRMLTEYESSFRSPLNRILEEGGAADGAVPQVRFSPVKHASSWGVGPLTGFITQAAGQMMS